MYETRKTLERTRNKGVLVIFVKKTNEAFYLSDGETKRERQIQENDRQRVIRKCRKEHLGFEEKHFDTTGDANVWVFNRRRQM